MAAIVRFDKVVFQSNHLETFARKFSKANFLEKIRHELNALEG